MPQLIDESAEYRLLGAVYDKPTEILRLTSELFTGDRVLLYSAMRKAYLEFGEIAYEGIERFYGRSLPPELETARGSKLAAVLDHLADVATRRQLARIDEAIVLLMAQHNLDRDEINKALTLRPILTKEDSGLQSGITSFVSEFQRKATGQYRFVRTGIEFMDHMLGGEWPRQALTVIMGGSGSGKTALICQSILNMARMKIPTTFVSLEMAKPKLVARFVANMANVDGLRIREGNVNQEERKRMDLALEELQSLPIFIEANPEMTIDQIVYMIKSHKEVHGIEAFFVDYLQIIDQSKKSYSRSDENGAEELGILTQRLRNLAVVEELSGILLSQQNRQYKGLQSLLGSGRIGHIADSVLEIVADSQSTNDDTRPCMIEFHKNRDGPVGSCGILYKPRFLRFE